MKKILFSIFGGAIILVSCGKDGGGSASIVGKWNTNRVVAQTFTNNELQGSDTTTTGSIEFVNNGDFISTDEDGDTSMGTYTYNTSSKLLSVISDNDTSNLNVTNLTSDNLHFNADQTKPVNGFTVRVTVDADYRR